MHSWCELAISPLHLPTPVCASSTFNSMPRPLECDEMMASHTSQPTTRCTRQYKPSVALAVTPCQASDADEFEYARVYLGELDGGFVAFAAFTEKESPAQARGRSE